MKRVVVAFGLLLSLAGLVQAQLTQKPVTEVYDFKNGFKIRGVPFTGTGSTPLTTIVPSTLGGMGTDIHLVSAGHYPKATGANPALFIASTLGAAGTGACSNTFVSGLNGDAPPTCGNTLGALGLNTSVGAAGTLRSVLGANGVTGLEMQRATDTAPTGAFLDFLAANRASAFRVDTTGAITVGSYAGVPIPLAYLSGQLVPSLGGLVYTDANGLALLPAPGTSGLILQSIAGDVPSYSTAIYPITITADHALASVTDDIITPLALTDCPDTAGQHWNYTHASGITCGTSGATAGTVTHTGTLTPLAILLGNGGADLTALAGNTTTTRRFLQQTGDGAAISSTSLVTLADSDIPAALTGKTYNALTLTAQTTGFTVAGGTTSKTLTVDADISTANVALLTAANTFSSATGQSMKKLLLPGSSSGTLTVQAPAAAGSNTLTLPGGTTDFSATGGTSQVVKQTSVGGAFTVARLACADLSDAGAGCSGAAGGVTSLTGTANQVLVSASTGAITLSAPQNLDTAAAFRIGSLGVNQAASTAGSVALIASTNGMTMLSLQRFTDTSPSGSFANFKTAGGSTLFSVDITGAVTGQKFNKLTLTAPATGATLTLADGKTFTVSNTLTFTGTDSSSVAFGAGGTVAYTGVDVNTSGQVTATHLASALPVAQGGTGLTSGTSGGILAYTASGTLASSGVLAANLPVIGGGAGVAPSSGTRSGNTTTFATTSGTLTSGNCAKFDASGNVVDNGSTCGSGGGNVSNTGTPTSGQAAEWTSATVIQGVAVTGTGSYAKATSPALVTPTFLLASPPSGNTITVQTQTSNHASFLYLAAKGTMTAGNASEIDIYSTDVVADATNTEQLSVGKTVNDFGYIQTYAGGTGAVRNFMIGPAEGLTQSHGLYMPVTKSVTNNSAASIANLTLASNSSAAVIVNYSVQVIDASNHIQNEVGSVLCNVANSNGTITLGGTNGCVVAKSQPIISASGGTLTVTWTLTAANPSVLKVNANSSLTPSANYPKVTTTLHSLTGQAITLQ